MKNVGVEKMERIYIYNDGSGPSHPKGFTEWQGERVRIPGYEYLDVFFTAPISHNPGIFWNLTEGKSGSTIGKGGSTQKSALAAALEILNRHTRKYIEKTILTVVQEHGLSPMYLTIGKEG